MICQTLFFFKKGSGDLSTGIMEYSGSAHPVDRSRSERKHIFVQKKLSLAIRTYYFQSLCSRVMRYLSSVYPTTLLVLPSLLIDLGVK